jgi:hypothetical protein
MSTKPKPRTVADFKAAHDRDTIIPNKIRAGLAKLLEMGPEHYEYAEQFRALCGLQSAELAQYKGLFKRHWFVAQSMSSGGAREKQVWFGDAKVADRLRPSPPDKD